MAKSGAPARIAILGAGGRDFHNFNVAYRDDPRVEVVAFTAAQIPDLAGRRYPSALAGRRYPEGIPIVQEAELEGLVRAARVGQVVLAYSDLAHAEVMHLASRVLATGADFVLLGPDRTMLDARVPVIAVSAVRTGCGKSQTARWIAARARARGLRVAVVRHPMAYGDLERQAVQRFGDRGDLAAAGCTVEEREEYEPHLAAGNVVYAGVDYARVLARAESEADLVLWDGGNNDFPFVRPGLHVVLVDALRPGHATTHHPGEAVLRMADVVVVAKADAAAPDDVARLIDAVRAANPRATVVRGGSPIRLDDADAVRGRRVLVVEDGPTTTHGGMAFGAGYRAAIDAGAESVVHPQPFAAGEIAVLYDRYPHLGPVLPAMGYSAAQLDALARSINATPADVVVAGTPIDLAALAPLDKPVVRARYEFADLDRPGLGAVVERFLLRVGSPRA